VRYKKRQKKKTNIADTVVIYFSTVAESLSQTEIDSGTCVTHTRGILNEIFYWLFRYVRRHKSQHKRETSPLAR